jgi:hypothetical protein
VQVFTKAWIRAARRKRARSNAGVGSSDTEPLSSVQLDLIRRYAPSASFADVGCMWRLNGRVAFLAEELGATSVAAFDAMERTSEFDAEHQRRSSSVRFVRGDLNAPTLAQDVGLHDVVWCSGVLYHAPNPLLSLERLGSLTKRYLIIGTKTLPEVPGLPQAAVFFPGLSPRERAAYGPLWGGGITAPYNPAPELSYANWWWGLTPSAIKAMFTLGGDWRVVESHEGTWGSVDDNFFIVAERVTAR